MPGKHKKKKHNKSAGGPTTASKPPAPISENAELVPSGEAEKPSPIPSPVPPSQQITMAPPPPTAVAPQSSKGEGGGDDTVVLKESPVLTAVRALVKVIEDYNGSTVNGLISELKAAKRQHSKAEGSQIQTKSKLAVDSARAQFIRYATLTLSNVEAEDVSKCREQMLCEGLKYLRSCERSVDKISRWAVTLIFDGARILVHSDSLVVLETLRSVPKNIYFSIYIVLDKDTVSKFFEENYNIDLHIIRDAEVGTLMESMDLVMVGAEAVLKNGGIINKVGTLSMAICAREMNKPMYVLAESFKFSLMYPLSQTDLPKDCRVDSITKGIRVDYTLPKYITFLVTDRGLLTPTAVCDELIELYT